MEKTPVFKRIVYKIFPHFVIRGLQILRNEGFYTFIYKVKIHRHSDKDYEKWITGIESEEESKEKKELGNKPLISVLVPVYNVCKKHLTECIESVISQTYDNWQLCMCDDCSTMHEVREVLSKYEDNPKIDIIYRTENGHISNATNDALSLAKGEFIALLDCDDTLAPHALYEVAKAIDDNPELDYLYSDEDKIENNGKNRHMPHFKADWSPDTLMSYMYTCHLSVYRRKTVCELGGFRCGYEGSQDYDMALRFTEKIPPSHIKHITGILYHWRVRKESTAADASAKPYIMESAYKAKSDAVKRRGLNANIELIKDIWQYRVNYIPKGNDKVSIIIPSKDNPDVICRCIKSIREKTLYKNYEIIVVDNGSNDVCKKEYEDICNKYDCKYHYELLEFNFSKMSNNGAKLAAGEYLLFLNDDTEVINGEWLERMLGQAQLSHTGAVGAKLLYPDTELIQHTGVINIANGPSHALCGYSDNDIYYFARNILDFNYLAVTAACLMVSKDKFFETGGFNEELAVAYNDVDFCFKLIESGYYNVVRNDVVLYHYESLSRGYDVEDTAKLKRLENERKKLYKLHKDFIASYGMDPFYNRYLTQVNNDFSYNYMMSEYLSCNYKIKSISDYMESGDIVCHVDIMRLKTSVRISGWAYIKNKRFNNMYKVKILFISKDETVTEVDTEKMYRPEVFADKPYSRMSMIGFECVTGKNIIESDKKYKIAVAINGRMKYIDETLG